MADSHSTTVQATDTRLHSQNKYIYPDAVPPIHVVSYHVATDKPSAQNGDKFRSIFSDNLQPIATRGKKARGTLLVDNTAATAVPLSVHPSPLVITTKSAAAILGGPLFEGGVQPAQYTAPVGWPAVEYIACWCCSLIECSKQLTAEEFYSRDGGVYCSVDFRRLFAVHCHACGQVVEGEVVTVLDNNFHPDCCHCSRCGYTSSPVFLTVDLSVRGV